MSTAVFQWKLSLWDWHWISYNFYDSSFLPFKNVKTTLCLRAAQTLEVATFGPFWPAGYHLPALALDFSFRVAWTGIVESSERACSAWYSIIFFGVWGVRPWSELVLYLFPAALYRLWSVSVPAAGETDSPPTFPDTGVVVLYIVSCLLILTFTTRIPGSFKIHFVMFLSHQQTFYSVSS